MFLKWTHLSIVMKIKQGFKVLLGITLFVSIAAKSASYFLQKEVNQTLGKSPEYQNILNRYLPNHNKQKATYRFKLDIDRELNMLKGPVRTVSSVSRLCEISRGMKIKGLILSSVYFEYDYFGNETMEVATSQYSATNSKRKYEYADDLKTLEIFNSGSNITNIKYKYNTEERFVEYLIEKEGSSEIFRMIYDGNGREKEYWKKGSNGFVIKKLFEYDQHGNKIRIFEYMGDEIQNTHLYKYDTSNNMVLSQYFSKNYGNVPVYSIQKNYDESNNIISYTETSYDGESDYYEFSNVTKDEMGNVLKKEVYMNGTLYSCTESEYTYYE